MIRNIVFDVSNVLAPFLFKEYLIGKGFDGNMIKRIYKASVMSPYWDQFERGLLSEEEVLEAFISNDKEIEKEIHIAFDDAKGMMGRYDYTDEWIDSLKSAGYKVYGITNFTPGGYRQCYDSISFIEKFDGIVLSFKEGVTKPDRKIYEIFLDRYGVRAEECVFIDDTKVNVTAAKEVGMEGVVFEGYEDAVNQLKELGVTTK